jgi:hypothetical protein
VRLGAQRRSETCAQGLGAYLRLGFFVSIFAQVELLSSDSGIGTLYEYEVIK